MVRGGRPRSSARSSLVRLRPLQRGPGNARTSAPKHHPVKEDLELLERRVSRTALHDPVFRNWRQNLPDIRFLQPIHRRTAPHLGVPEADMLHRAVLALITMSPVRELPMQALARTLLAEIMTMLTAQYRS